MHLTSVMAYVGLCFCSVCGTCNFLKIRFFFQKVLAHFHLIGCRPFVSRLVYLMFFFLLILVNFIKIKLIQIGQYFWKSLSSTNRTLFKKYQFFSIICFFVKSLLAVYFVEWFNHRIFFGEGNRNHGVCTIYLI